MTQFKNKDRIVDAYQHRPNLNNDTVSYPRWFVDLVVKEQIREMPDHSVHVTLADGSVLPLPIGYWLIQDSTDSADEPTLYVVAPDVFAAQYDEV